MTGALKAAISQTVRGIFHRGVERMGVRWIWLTRRNMDR